MKKIVKGLIGECDLYCKSKANKYALYGLLQSPPVKDGAWKSIAFDFIVKLSLSRDPLIYTVFDSIWVVTNRLIKYGCFIPYLKSSTVKQLTYSFIKVVISQRGLLNEIISDKNKLFIFKF